MPADPIYVDNALFLGRVEEQKQFRAALTEVLAAPPDENLPYIFLLYGDGGMGKTTLAKRFRDIAQTEPPFESAFQILWIDWEDERRRTARLQVGREHISPEVVFDILHEKAVQARWGGDFGAYQKAVKERGVAEKKAAAAFEPSGERDDLAALRGAGASAISKILRVSLPIGDTGEKLAKAFLDAGIKVGAEQAAQLRTAAETRLRARLDPEQFNLFLNPNEQLARALAEGLRKIAAHKPLIIFSDTYEIVDRTDIWLRETMCAAGSCVVWIISGRNNLVQSRQFGAEYFKGYAEEFSRRLVARDMLQLSEQDIRDIFADKAPERALDESAISALSRATRGVPLAIDEAAEMWAKGIALADIVGEIDESVPRGQIVQKMTARYFLHVPDADKPALYALALARGDIEILRAMLRPADAAPFDLDALLHRLERDYASVHYEHARLHEEPALFIREDLKDEIHRADDRVRMFNQRTVETLRARLEKLQADLPRLEDRCADDDWAKAALDLTDYLFWLDESQAWHWLVPRFIESLAYSRELRRGLAQTAQAWEHWLSAIGKKRGKVLRVADDAEHSSDEWAELLDELTRLESLGWLKGEGESERCAILDWVRGQLLYAREKYTEALAQYECVERELPEQGEALKEQLAEAFRDVGWELGWERDIAIPSEQAESALSHAVALQPEKSAYRVGLGVMLYGLKKLEKAANEIKRGIALGEDKAWAWNWLGNAYHAFGKNDDALAAFQRAIQLDPKYGAPHNGAGNAYGALRKYDDALAALQRAIQLDPKVAYPHNGLGHVYRALGKYDDALAAFQCAIDLDPKLATPHNGIGNVYFDLKRYDDALAAYQRAIELDPKYATPHNGSGNTYRALGKYDDALAAFQCAIELDPKYASPHNGIGNVYSDLKRYDDALAAYQRAIERDPKDATSHNNMATIFVEQGKFDDARREYSERIRLAPDNTFTPLVALGILARHQGLAENDKQFQDALAQWDAAWRAQWQTPAGLLENKAKALLCLGKKDEALQVLKQAIAEMLPRDEIQFDDYTLLQTAPVPPAGVEEMIAMLKEAQAQRQS